MATGLQDEEEFNPFLQPPPPPLNPTIAAPALPPRTNTSTSNNGSSNAGTEISTSRTRSSGDVDGDQRSSGSSPPPYAPPAPPTTATTGSSTPPLQRPGYPSTSTPTSTSASRPPRRVSPPSRNPFSSSSSSSNSNSTPASCSASPPAASATAASATATPAPAPAPVPALPAAPTTSGGGSGGAGPTHRRGSRSAGRSAGGSSGGASSSRANTVSPAPTSSTTPATATSPATTATGGPSAASSANTSPGSGSRRGGSWNWGNLGRSLIGAVLGPGAVGGEEGAGDQTMAGSGGRVNFRVLTPHEMQQTPEGKFNVAVWRKNKQDAEPVKVAVGLYDSAYEGQRAAEAFSPPLWQEPAKNARCAVCDSTFGYVLKRRHHCRNCGRLVCSSCAQQFWPRNMLPPTYSVDTGEKKVRVCSTCYNAGEDFRKALLSGSEEGAMAAYSTGCVNLRVPYTIYHNELPVHCAAAGGNLNILAWLVDDRCCPLFLDRAKKIALGDSRRLSVMGAAAASGHIQIMRYLAFTQGCKVTEIRDMNSLWGALEKCLYDGANVVPEASSHHSRRHNSGSPALSGGGGGGGGTYPSPAGAAGGAEVVAADDDSSCIVCFENRVDCTLVPCGHHCCCMTCADQFEQCPVCRADVEQKVRAISV